MRIYCTKLFGRVVQSVSKFSRSSYFRKKLVGLLTSFFIFGLWAVSSQTFDKKTTGLPKLPSTVSEIFRGEKLCHQKKFFPAVSDFELMIFGLLVKKYGRLTKTALYVSREDFRRKNSFKLKSFFSISLWIRADGFQDSGKKMSQISPKLHSTCPDWHFAKKSFGEKEFNTFGLSGKIYQNFGSRESKRYFWGNKFCIKSFFESFTDFGREPFKLLPKSSQQRCQNSILRIQRMNARKAKLGSIQFSDFLGHRATFLDIMRRVFAGL